MPYWISILTPLVVVLLAAGTGALTYANQKRLDRETEIIKTRQEVYVRYLRAMAEISQPDKKTEARTALGLARAEAMIYGSDVTLRAIDKFSTIIDVKDEAEIATRGADFASRALAGYGELVKAMRDDVIDDSSLTAAELTSLAPFKKSS